jgi:Flp pilus assembly protein TadG
MANHPIKKYSFMRDARGNAMFLGAAMLMVIVAGVGSAVDASRAYIVRNRLSNALDAAGLAAGSVASSANVQQVAQKYFDINFPATYMGVESTNLTATLNADRTLVTLDASTTVPSSIMQVFGFSGIDLTVHSEITRESRGMELVLVMDNTGSMNDNGKLTTMKQAATDLINILYGDKDEMDNFWVGLVPYSQTVNIGSGRQAWLDGVDFATKNYGPDPWAGCVDARPYPGDTRDDPPALNPFKSYFWPDHNTYNNWINNFGGYYSGLGPEKGPNKYCPQPILPLTKNKSTILNAIAGMEARGNTHSNFGLVWGWRVLSPRWRTLWGSDDNNTLPLDYNTPLMEKVVIVLTDGVNTHSNSSHTAYGYLSDGVLGTTSSSGAVTVLNNRMAEICNNMKANDVIVYTITFQLSSTGTQMLFRNCASTPDFYYNSPTNAQLTAAFHQIADSLANLRVSK